jgi:universal stress protein A
MEEIRRILVVSWITQHCRRAVHFGVSLARKYKAELGVVHIVSQNPFELSGGSLPVDTVEEDYKKYQNETKTMLDEILASESKRGLSVKEFVRYGNPTEEVRKLVREEEIDLAVMVAHEQSRLKPFTYGRSVEELVRKMPCSLLLVRSED